MWRQLSASVPNSTRIDVERYAAELDAVDVALRKNEEWTPSPIDCRTLAIVETGDGAPVELVVQVRPQQPIRGDDPARIAVAVLQRFAWVNAAAWLISEERPTVPGYDVDHFGSLYGMAATLLRRRLQPSIEVAADLVAFAVAPPSDPAGRVTRADFLAPILKILEKQFAPPVDKTLKRSLMKLEERVGRLGREKAAVQRQGKRRVATKRSDDALSRIQRLIG